MTSLRTFCLSLAMVLAAAQSASAQQSLTASRPMTDGELESLIGSLGLEAERNESRFDFEFLATMGEDQWKLSMSSILSQDGQTVWLMAWLDELPKSAAEVPRTSLLRLLAENDKMGNGKFFAYIAGSRRFVLQRIVSTNGLNAESLKLALQDLGSTVVQTHPQWSVANWVPAAPAAPIARVPQPVEQPRRTAEAIQSASQSAINESKFELPVRK